MHHERLSLFQRRNSFFLIYLPFPQSSSAGGLWSCGYCYSESELTQTTHSLTTDKSSNISTWFAFLGILLFSLLPALFPTTSYYETSSYQHWIFKSLSIKKRKANLFLKGRIKKWTFCSLFFFFFLCLSADTCSFSCCKVNLANWLRGRLSCMLTLLLGTFVECDL